MPGSTYDAVARANGGASNETHTYQRPSPSGDTDPGSFVGSQVVKPPRPLRRCDGVAAVVVVLLVVGCTVGLRLWGASIGGLWGGSGRGG